ncbi:hypothetical protein JCM11641_000940 [Rhodosporidiobolus odoratus]
MLSHVALLSLATAAFAVAVPAPTSSSSVFTVVDAFRSLRSLDKRQYGGLSDGDTETLAGLEDLLQDGLVASQTDGKCSAECTPWINEIMDCATLSSSYAIGNCACGFSELQGMKTCGDCFGSSSSSDASGEFRSLLPHGRSSLTRSVTADFDDYCRTYGGGDYASSASSRNGSGFTSVSSAVASATSRFSSAASLTSSRDDNDVGITNTSGGGSRAPAATESPSAGVNSQEEGGDSAAGVVRVGVALAVGMAGGVAAALAL